MTTTMTRAERRAEYEFMSAACAELDRDLNRSTGPVSQSRAWAKYRKTIYTDRGLEGLTGPRAVYHFDDVRQHLFNAIGMLAKGDIGLAPWQWPAQTMKIIMRAHGYRYLRGVQGLADAIKEACPARLSQYLDEREAFDAEFKLRATAASITNEDGECPAAVVKVLQMFADELRALGVWLTRVRSPWAGGTPLLDRIERELDDYRAELAASPGAGRDRSRSRSSRRRR